MGMIREGFNRLSVDRKILLSFALPLLAMLIISLSAIHFSLDAYDRRLYQSTEKELAYFLERVDQSISAIEALSYDTALDYDNQRLLYDAQHSNDIAMYNYLMRQVSLRFVQQIVNNTNVVNYLYVSPEGAEYANGNLSVEISDERKEKVLEKALEAQGQFVFITPDSNFPFLVSARMIRHYINADLTYLGTIIFVSDISTILSGGIDALETSRSFLTILDGDVLVYTNREDHDPDAFISELDDEGYGIIKEGRERYFAVSGISERRDGDLSTPFHMRISSS